MFVIPTTSDFKKIDLKKIDNTNKNSFLYNHIVESDGRDVYYLYHPNKKYSQRFCWIGVTDITELSDMNKILLTLSSDSYNYTNNDIKKLRCDIENMSNGLIFVADNYGTVIKMSYFSFDDYYEMEGVVYPKPSELSTETLSAMEKLYYEDVLDDDALSDTKKFMSLSDEEKDACGFGYYFDLWDNTAFMEKYYEEFSIQKEKSSFFNKFGTVFVE